MDIPNDEAKKQNPKILPIAAWGIVISLTIVLLKQYEPIIKPFFIAFFFWYMIKELRLQLAKIKINGKMLAKPIRGILAILVIVGVITLIVEIISVNLRQVTVYFKDFGTQIDLWTGQLAGNTFYDTVFQEISKMIDEFEFGKLAGQVANFVSNTVADTAIVLIYLVFMLLEEAVASKKMEVLFRDRKQQYENFMHTADSISVSIGKYLTSKTTVSLILGVACYIIMLFFGLKFALLWGFLIFLFNYIPYVGSLIATLFPSLFAAIQFGDGSYFLYVFISIEIMQIIMANVVEPRLMGKSLNLSPITVLLSLAFWGSLWGIVGMILAVPITAVMMIILSQFDSTRYIAVLLSEKGSVVQ